MLRSNAKIFHCLCRASSEFNHIFSFPVLILLTTKFVVVINTVFITSPMDSEEIQTEEQINSIHTRNVKRYIRFGIKTLDIN
jgi:hypothetical protein